MFLQCAKQRYIETQILYARFNSKDKKKSYLVCIIIKFLSHYYN